MYKLISLNMSDDSALDDFFNTQIVQELLSAFPNYRLDENGFVLSEVKRFRATGTPVSSLNPLQKSIRALYAFFLFKSKPIPTFLRQLLTDLPDDTFRSAFKKVNDELAGSPTVVNLSSNAACIGFLAANSPHAAIHFCEKLTGFVVHADNINTDAKTQNVVTQLGSAFDMVAQKYTDYRQQLPSQHPERHARLMRHFFECLFGNDACMEAVYERASSTAVAVEYNVLDDFSIPTLSEFSENYTAEYAPYDDSNHADYRSIFRSKNSAIDEADLVILCAYAQDSISLILATAERILTRQFIFYHYPEVVDFGNQAQFNAVMGRISETPALKRQLTAYCKDHARMMSIISSNDAITGLIKTLIAAAARVGVTISMRECVNLVSRVLDLNDFRYRDRVSDQLRLQQVVNRRLTDPTEELCRLKAEGFVTEADKTLQPVAFSDQQMTAMLVMIGQVRELQVAFYDKILMLHGCPSHIRRVYEITRELQSRKRCQDGLKVGLRSKVFPKDELLRDPDLIKKAVYGGYSPNESPVVTGNEANPLSYIYYYLSNQQGTVVNTQEIIAMALGLYFGELTPNQRQVLTHELWEFSNRTIIENPFGGVVVIFADEETFFSNTFPAHNGVDHCNCFSANFAQQISVISKSKSPILPGTEHSCRPAANRTLTRSGNQSTGIMPSPRLLWTDSVEQSAIQVLLVHPAHAAEIQIAERCELRSLLDLYIPIRPIADFQGPLNELPDLSQVRFSNDSVEKLLTALRTRPFSPDAIPEIALQLQLLLENPNLGNKKSDVALQIRWVRLHLAKQQLQDLALQNELILNPTDLAHLFLYNPDLVNDFYPLWRNNREKVNELAAKHIDLELAVLSRQHGANFSCPIPSEFDLLLAFELSLILDSASKLPPNVIKTLMKFQASVRYRELIRLIVTLSNAELRALQLNSDEKKLLNIRRKLFGQGAYQLDTTDDLTVREKLIPYLRFILTLDPHAFSDARSAKIARNLRIGLDIIAGMGSTILACTFLGTAINSNSRRLMLSTDKVLDWRSQLNCLALSSKDCRVNQSPVFTDNTNLSVTIQAQFIIASFMILFRFIYLLTVLARMEGTNIFYVGSVMGSAITSALGYLAIRSNPFRVEMSDHLAVTSGCNCNVSASTHSLMVEAEHVEGLNSYSSIMNGFFYFCGWLFISLMLNLAFLAFRFRRSRAATERSDGANRLKAQIDQAREHFNSRLEAPKAKVEPHLQLVVVNPQQPGHIELDLMEEPATDSDTGDTYMESAA